MVWSDPFSIDEYIAFQLAALAFLFHKKGMKEPSQLLIGMRNELLSKMDDTVRAEANAAQASHASNDANTAPAK